MLIADVRRANLSGVVVIPTAVSYIAEAEQLVFLASTVVSEQLDSYCTTVGTYFRYVVPVSRE
jgi:hypothetical protein